MPPRTGQEFDKSAWKKQVKLGREAAAKREKDAESERSRRRLDAMTAEPGGTKPIGTAALRAALRPSERFF
jgi:hypothetical protein